MAALHVDSPAPMVLTAWRGPECSLRAAGPDTETARIPPRRERFSPGRHAVQTSRGAAGRGGSNGVRVIWTTANRRPPGRGVAAGRGAVAAGSPHGLIVLLSCKDATPLLAG